jgi:hypothetical protein
MLDLVIDRRELKPLLAAALRFMGAERSTREAVDVVPEAPVSTEVPTV